MTSKVTGGLLDSGQHSTARTDDSETAPSSGLAVSVPGDEKAVTAFSEAVLTTGQVSVQPQWQGEGVLSVKTTCGIAAAETAGVSAVQMPHGGVQQPRPSNTHGEVAGSSVHWLTSALASEAKSAQQAAAAAAAAAATATAAAPAGHDSGLRHAGAGSVAEQDAGLNSVTKSGGQSAQPVALHAVQLPEVQERLHQLPDTATPDAATQTEVMAAHHHSGTAAVTGAVACTAAGEVPPSDSIISALAAIFRQQEAHVHLPVAEPAVIPPDPAASLETLLPVLPLHNTAVGTPQPLVPPSDMLQLLMGRVNASSTAIAATSTAASGQAAAAHVPAQLHSLHPPIGATGDCQQQQQQLKEPCQDQQDQQAGLLQSLAPHEPQHHHYHQQQQQQLGVFMPPLAAAAALPRAPAALSALPWSISAPAAAAWAGLQPGAPAGCPAAAVAAHKVMQLKRKASSSIPASPRALSPSGRTAAGVPDSTSSACAGVHSSTQLPPLAHGFFNRACSDGFAAAGPAGASALPAPPGQDGWDPMLSPWAWLGPHGAAFAAVQPRGFPTRATGVQQSGPGAGVLQESHPAADAACVQAAAGGHGPACGITAAGGTTASAGGAAGNALPTMAAAAAAIAGMAGLRFRSSGGGGGGSGSAPSVAGSGGPDGPQSGSAAFKLSAHTAAAMPAAVQTRSRKALRVAECGADAGQALWPLPQVEPEQQWHLAAHRASSTLSTALRQSQASADAVSGRVAAAGDAGAVVAQEALAQLEPTPGAPSWGCAWWQDEAWCQGWDSSSMAAAAAAASGFGSATAAEAAAVGYGWRRQGEEAHGLHVGRVQHCAADWVWDGQPASEGLQEGQQQQQQRGRRNATGQSKQGAARTPGRAAHHPKKAPGLNTEDVWGASSASLQSGVEALDAEHSSHKRGPRGGGGRSSTSNFRGVTQHRYTLRWEAHLWDPDATRCKTAGSARTRGRQTYLGGYDTKAEAARAYDRAALVYWGNEGHTNFPKENYAAELPLLCALQREQVVANLRHNSHAAQRFKRVYTGVVPHQALPGLFEARLYDGQVPPGYKYLGAYATQEAAATALVKALQERQHTQGPFQAAEMTDPQTNAAAMTPGAVLPLDNTTEEQLHGGSPAAATPIKAPAVAATTADTVAPGAVAASTGPAGCPVGVSDDGGGAVAAPGVYA